MEYFRIQTANKPISLFSKKKKNQIIRIFCISGWLTAPINPDKWSSTVSMRSCNICPDTDYKIPQGTSVRLVSTRTW